MPRDVISARKICDFARETLILHDRAARPVRPARAADADVHVAVCARDLEGAPLRPEVKVVERKRTEEDAIRGLDRRDVRHGVIDWLVDFRVIPNVLLDLV